MVKICPWTAIRRGLAAGLAAAFLASGPTSAQIDPGWRIDGFNGAPVERVADSLRIAGGGTPAGAVLVWEGALPPVAHLILDGAKSAGSVTLRLREDDGAYVWLPAPEGTVRLEVRATRRLEALIYSDGAFAYTLRTARLAPCVDCAREAPRTVASAFAARAGGWTSDLHRAPRIDPEADGGLRVRSTEGAGVFFRLPAGASGMRTLSLRGQNRQGQAILRLAQGDGAPVWLPAPDGETLDYDFPADKPLEVLIYADSAFDYALASLSATECAACFDDAGLRAMIAREVPLAADAAADPLARARALLDWTARTVDHGTDDDAIKRNTAAINWQPLAQYHRRVWMADAGGAWCGAFALYFARVLDLFGIPAFIVDFGVPGPPITHVTTVVPLASAGGTRFVVLDPMLNATFLDANGAVADLRAALVGRRTGTIRFAAAPVRRDAIVSAAMLARFEATRQAARTAAECRPTADGALCKNFAFDIDFLAAGEWQVGLTTLGIAPADAFLDLLGRGVLGIGGPAAERYKAEFRALLRAQAIRADF